MTRTTNGPQLAMNHSAEEGPQRGKIEAQLAQGSELFVQGKQMPPSWKSPVNHHAGYGSSKPTAAPHLFQGQLQSIHHCSENGWLSVYNVSKHNQKLPSTSVWVCVPLGHVQLFVTS